MSNHTPEPWQLDDNPDICTNFYSDDATGSIIGSCPEYKFAHRSIDERKANARRIVACVNACAGMRNGELEGGLLIGVMQAKIDRLEMQRDELLAALQGMIDIANDSQGVAGYHLNGEVADWGEFEEWQAACDAIAKVKGGAS